jgi:type VI secretion system protein VasJ
MSKTQSELLAILSQWENREAGEDPRYSDGFSQLRGEVEKLSGNDFERIRDLSHTVLREQALDLRVLAYTSLAYAYLYGVKGLADALAAWCWAIEFAWENCHPARPNARLGAFDWLRNERFPVYLNKHVCNQEDLEQLETQLTRFHSLLDDKIDDGPRLKAITDWLAEQKKKQPAVTESAAPEEDSADQSQAESTPQTSTRQQSATGPASPVGNIDNDKAEQKALRELLAWYRHEKRYEPMVRLSRSMRWSALAMPPADKGKTRIAPPRQASLNTVSSALDRQQWDEALLAAERTFLEPGGQFCLALQHAAFQAAQGLGLGNLADLISRECRALLTARRDLIKLQFSDGSPFLDGTAANWVESLMTDDSDSTASDDSLWGQVGVEAAAASQQDGLVAGLKVIDQTPTRGRKARSEQDLLKAELCLVNQRHDLALPLLEAVAERLDDHGIPAWEPTFALRVWRLLQQALRAQDNNEQAQMRLEQIGQHISRTDITAAAAML